MAIINTNSWDLDVTILQNYELPTILNGLDRVTSREGYHHLYKIFPELHGVELLEQVFNDEKFWAELQQLKDPYSLLSIHSNWKIPELLINIPMRQYWTDELNGLNDLDQLK
ncbi:hypothetical protein HDU76_008553, partial [Blyttiomyces sp. JEL0837]